MAEAKSALPLGGPISESTRADVMLRLRRIEGQVRGIQRMVEDSVSERILYKQFRAGEIIIVDTEDDPDNPGQKRICFRSIEGFQPPAVELAEAGPAGE